MGGSQWQQTGMYGTASLIPRLHLSHAAAGLKPGNEAVVMCSMVMCTWVPWARLYATVVRGSHKYLWPQDSNGIEHRANRNVQFMSWWRDNNYEINSEWPRLTSQVGCHFVLLNHVLSLVPSPRVPPGKKRSGERSRIPWAYSQKVVRTNEIVRSVIIT